MATAALNYHTPEEYLALERNAEFKSEYIDGLIVALAGATARHNSIAGHIYSGLLVRFRGRPCEAFMSDMRVRSVDGMRYTYPDVVALCGEPEYTKEVPDTLLNPALIVEVLSESTESYDRGTKFWGYRRIPTLREYVLVSQSTALVERFVREGDVWTYSEVSGLDGVLTLTSVECEIPLREIYERVRFENP